MTPHTLCPLSEFYEIFLFDTPIWLSVPGNGNSILLHIHIHIHIRIRIRIRQIPVLPRSEWTAQEARPARHLLHAPGHLADQHRLEALPVPPLLLPEHHPQVSVPPVYFWNFHEMSITFIRHNGHTAVACRRQR